MHLSFRTRICMERYSEVSSFEKPLNSAGQMPGSTGERLFCDFAHQKYDGINFYVVSLTFCFVLYRELAAHWPTETISQKVNFSLIMICSIFVVLYVHNKSIHHKCNKHITHVMLVK